LNKKNKTKISVDSLQEIISVRQRFQPMKMFWMCRCERDDENQTSPKIAKLSLAHRKSEPKKKIEPEEEEKKRNLETIPQLELEILEKVFSPRGKVNSLSYRRVGKEKRISSQRVKSLTPREILFSDTPCFETEETQSQTNETHSNKSGIFSKNEFSSEGTSDFSIDHPDILRYFNRNGI
jgi:hypothetical protein